MFDLYYDQNKSSTKEDAIMTTLGLIITLLGAGSIAANVNLMHLIDRLERRPQRRRTAA